MANQVEKLRKENNLTDKQLSKENDSIITDMVCYLKSSSLCEYDIEIIRKELTGMALESQLRNQEFSDVIGEDYKTMCDELMKNSRKKTGYEKVLELLYILVVGIGTLYLYEIITSSTIINIFKYGNFSMDITSGFIIGTLASVFIAFGIYYIVTKKSFEILKFRNKALFVVGFAISWTVIVLVRVYKGKSVLLTINCLYPLVFLAVAYIAIKYLSAKNDNKLFEIHK